MIINIGIVVFIFIFVQAINKVDRGHILDWINVELINIAATSTKMRRCLMSLALCNCACIAHSLFLLRISNSAYRASNSVLRLRRANRCVLFFRLSSAFLFFFILFRSSTRKMLKEQLFQISQRLFFYQFTIKDKNILKHKEISIMRLYYNRPHVWRACQQTPHS